MVACIKNVLVAILGVAMSGLVVAWATPAALGSADLPNERRLGGDVVCGPRCVQFVLEWYGRDGEDLFQLVREIQWPDLEAGATLSAIDVALRKREIHICALQMPGSARLRWPYPVILHLEPDNSADARQTLGHFVVWLPSSSARRCDVWNGLAGKRSYPHPELAGRLSGAVLLTSPTPITDPSEAVYNRTSPLIYTIGAFMAVAGGILVVGRSNAVRFVTWISGSH